MGCLDIFTGYYNAAGETITKINVLLESSSESGDPIRDSTP
jgi:hypothetical protein